MSTALVKHTAQQQIARAEESMTFGEMVSMGDQLVRTGFLPQHIKTGAQAAAIIMTGRELGMPPMTAMRSLTMVKGKVVENADSQLARFKADGGRCTFAELSEKAARAQFVHPNGDKHEESFTIEDARRAGLSGDNWQKYPKAMLRSRCITAGLKSLGWAGAVGNYDPDEAAAFSEAPKDTPRPTPAPVVAAKAVVNAEPVQAATVTEQYMEREGPTEQQAKDIKAALIALMVTKDKADYIDAIYNNAKTVDDYDVILTELNHRLILLQEKTRAPQAELLDEQAMADYERETSNER